jgi:heme-degrading monooxygenase HmoA
MIASTPAPPYYAVIFSSLRTENNDGYLKTSKRMVELAEQADGFLGYESVRERLGITISYWKDLDSIRKWKENAEHTLAREKGRKEWYRAFKVRVAEVKREFGDSV